MDPSEPVGPLRLISFGERSPMFRFNSYYYCYFYFRGAAFRPEEVSV